MRKIRFGIVGTNFISDWFVEASKLTNAVEIAAVYSRNFDTGRAFAEKHGIESIYIDCKQMFSSDIDAVYIASPTMYHKEHAMLAMKHGKHVLCEKMIGANFADFLEMKDFSLKSSRVLLEAMRPLFDPAYIKIRELIGSIGRIKGASLEYLQYSSRYDKFKAGIVENAFNPAMKNSALADIGIYPLNTCVAIFGEPKAISASSVFLSNGFEGEGSLVLSYSDFSANVIYSKIRNGERPSVIIGELGELEIDKISAPNLLTLKLKDEPKREICLNSPQFNLNMMYEISAFCKMVRGELDHIPYLLHTESVMRCVDSVYRAVGINF